MKKKLCCILMLIVLLLNSSLMLVVSEAVEAVQTAVEKAQEADKRQAINEINLTKYENFDTTTVNGQEGKSGSKGTLVQFNLKTGLKLAEGVDYIPFKQTSVTMELPEVVDYKPSRVEVITKSTQATNGGKSASYEYNASTGILTITAENKDYKDNVVDARDEYDIICIYREECYSATNEERDLKVRANVEVTLNDENSTKVLVNAEKEGKVTEKIGNIISAEYKTEDIYNGYIEANGLNENNKYETTFKETAKIEISNKDLAQKYMMTWVNKFENDKQELDDTSMLTYKETSIDKAKFINTFGEKANLDILNNEGKTLKTINKDTETDENGKVTIKYEDNTQNVVIKLTGIEKEGIIEFENTKCISSNMKDLTYNKINTYMIAEGYNTIQIQQESSESKETENKVTESKVTESKTTEDKKVYQVVEKNTTQIKNAISNIETKLDNNTWVNNAANEVNLTAILKTNTSKDSLFKNPTITVELPSEVEEAIITEPYLVYNNLKFEIEEAKVIVNENKNKAIKITLKGSQENYEQNTIAGGINIIVPLKVYLRKSLETTETTIKTTYTNENTKETVYSEQGKKCDELKISLVNKIVVATPVLYSADQNYVQVIEKDGIRVEIFRKVGNQYLPEEGTVYEQQLINNTIKVTNTNTSAKSVNFSIDIPDTMTWVVLNQKECDYNEKYGYYKRYAIYEYETRATKKIDINLKEIKAGETVENSFDLRINDLADTEESKVSSVNYQMVIGKTQYSFSNKLQIKQAEIKAELSVTVGTGKNDWIYKFTVENKSDKELTDIDLTFEASAFFEITSIDNNYGSFDGNMWRHNLSKLAKGEKENFWIRGNVNEYSEDNDFEYQLKAVATAKASNVYISNETSSTGYVEGVEVTMSSNKEGQKLRINDEIEYTVNIKNIGKTRKWYTTYTKINVKDYIPYELTPISVSYNNYKVEVTKVKDVEQPTITQNVENFTEIQQEQELALVDKDTEDVANVNKDLIIPQGKTITLKIKARARMIYENKEATNKVDVSGEYIKTKTASLTNTVVKYDEPENPDPEEPEKIKVTGITLNNTDLTLKVGDSQKLTATIFPENADNKNVIWTSGNYLVADVDNAGNITAKSAGKTTITATTEDEAKVAICNVVVVNDTIDPNPEPGDVSVTGVYISNQSINLKVNENKQLYATVIPENAANKNITWSSNNNQVATVDENGNVIARGEGTAVITVTTEDGGKTAQCTVTVSKKQDSTTPDNPTPSETITISGVAWIDENENGKRDDEEKLYSNMDVLLYDYSAQKLVYKDGIAIRATTNEKGEYEFTNITKGEYIVVFLYDSKTYSLTEYQKQGVSSTKNSDAIEKNVLLEGKETIAGLTDTLTAQSTLKNIDIGVIKNKSFDMELQKYISKITVQTKKGTKTYDYNNKKLAKVEINSKYINGATVVLEYKMVVTNKGELEGKVGMIVDSIPDGLEFHSELNPNWYEKGGKLYTIALSGEKIGVGESREVTIVFTKTMNSNNVGKIENVANIDMSSNEKAVEDNNKDNDTSKVEVIIGLTTGVKQAMIVITTGSMIVGLIILVIILAKKNKNFRMFAIVSLIFVIGGTVISIAGGMTETSSGTPNAYISQTGNTAYTIYAYNVLKGEYDSATLDYGATIKGHNTGKTYPFNEGFNPGDDVGNTSTTSNGYDFICINEGEPFPNIDTSYFIEKIEPGTPQYESSSEPDLTLDRDNPDPNRVEFYNISNEINTIGPFDPCFKINSDKYINTDFAKLSYVVTMDYMTNDGTMHYGEVVDNSRLWTAEEGIGTPQNPYGISKPNSADGNDIAGPFYIKIGKDVVYVTNVRISLKYETLKDVTVKIGVKVTVDIYATADHQKMKRDSGGGDISITVPTSTVWEGSVEWGGPWRGPTTLVLHKKDPEWEWDTRTGIPMNNADFLLLRGKDLNRNDYLMLTDLDGNRIDRLTQDDTAGWITFDKIMKLDDSEPDYDCGPNSLNGDFYNSYDQQNNNTDKSFPHYPRENLNCNKYQIYNKNAQALVFANGKYYLANFGATKENATRLSTNGECKIGIGNLRWGEYTFVEARSNRYEYTQVKTTVLYGNMNRAWVETHFWVENKRQTGNLRIYKRDTDQDRPLENVEFVMTANVNQLIVNNKDINYEERANINGKYVILQIEQVANNSSFEAHDLNSINGLKDQRGETITQVRDSTVTWAKRVKGMVKVSDVAFTDDRDKATRLTTNNEGVIGLINLLMSSKGYADNYQNKEDQITYELHEVNSNNYGYAPYYKYETSSAMHIEAKSNNSGSITKEGDITLKRQNTHHTAYTPWNNSGINESNCLYITIKNDKLTQNLHIFKKDYDQHNQLLPGVTFRIIAKLDGNKEINGKYIRIKASGDNVEKGADGYANKITGSARVDDRLYNTRGLKEEIKADERQIKYTTDVEQATLFVTDSSGKIEIQNLLTSLNGTNRIQYHLEEIENPNYGWVAEKGNYNNYTVHFTTNDSANGTVTDNDSIDIKSKDGVKARGWIKLNRQKSQETDKTTGGSGLDVNVLNVKQTSNLFIEKVDSRNTDKKLPNVSFTLKAQRDKDISHIENRYKNIDNKYVRIKTSENGNWEKEVKGTVLVKDIDYVSNMDDATVFITDEQGKIEIYNLLMSTNGADIIKYHIEEIKNENYGYLSDDNKYKNFRVDYGSNAPDGWVTLTRLPSTETENTSSKKGENVQVKNEQMYIRASGYVWEDIADGKSNTIDSIYKDESDALVKGIRVYLHKTDGNKDSVIATILTDENGYYEFGTKIVNGKKYINSVEQPGTFDNGYENKDYWSDKEPSVNGNNFTSKPENENGNLVIQDLEKYYIEFEYDGLKFTTVATKWDYANRDDEYSKAAEVPKDGSRAEGSDKKRDRETVNDDFSEIWQNRSTGYGLSYVVNKEDHIATYTDKWAYKYENNSSGKKILNITDAALNKNHEYAVVSTTEESGYKIALKWKEAYQNTGLECITNNNQGIFRREQADNAISEDIDSVDVIVNGYKNTYQYGGRKEYQKEGDVEETSDGFGVAVKFGNKNNSSQYSSRGLNIYQRPLYESDLAWHLSDPTNNVMEVYVTYKIVVKNQSDTLTTSITQLANYFDRRYTLVQSWIGDNTGSEVKWLDKSNDRGTGDYNSKYYSTEYTKDLNLSLEPGKTSTVYVKFKLNDDALQDIAHEKATLMNVVEISTFTSYYGNDTIIAGVKAAKTVNDEVNNVGNIYAAIDKDSAPLDATVGATGSPKEQTITRPDGSTLKYYDQNLELTDKGTFEDDTDFAPSLILGIDETDPTRAISGIVWEDATTEEDVERTNRRLGDGIYQNNEKLVENAQINLIKATDKKLGNPEDTDKETDNNLATVYRLEVTGNDSSKVEAKVDKARVYSAKTLSAPVRTGYSDQEAYKYNWIIIGVIPDENYRLRYAYGTFDDKTVSMIEGNEVDAREYKSTIVVASPMLEELQKATGENTTDEPNKNWVIDNVDKQNSTRSNVAIDANLKSREESDNIYYGSYIQKIKMFADSAIFDIKVENNNCVTVDQPSNPKNTSSKYDEEFILIEENGKEFVKRKPTFYSVIPFLDFGITLRPKQKLYLDKTISNLSITLANGQSIIYGNPYTDSLSYIKALEFGEYRRVLAEMDNEIIEGATVKIEYKITITNYSEIDYDYRKYTGYYYWGKEDNNYILKNVVNSVGDYMTGGIQDEEEKNVSPRNPADWKKRSLEYLTGEEEENGKRLINDKVENGIKSFQKDNNIVILESQNIEDIEPPQTYGQAGGSTTLHLYGSKLLAVNENGVKLINNAEILGTFKKVTDKTTGKSVTPGNYNPADRSVHECDDSRIEFIITPPTGLSAKELRELEAKEQMKKIFSPMTILKGGYCLIKKKY